MPPIVVKSVLTEKYESTNFTTIGGRRVKIISNHQLTLEMAKHIAMVQRSEIANKINFSNSLIKQYSVLTKKVSYQLLEQFKKIQRLTGNQKVTEVTFEVTRPS